MELRSPHAQEFVVSRDDPQGAPQRYAAGPWAEAERVLRRGLRSGGHTVRLDAGVEPGSGLPQSMTISGGPDDPAAPKPVHPNDIYRSAELRVGRYRVVIGYANPEVGTFSLRNVSLAAAIEVARVFYEVGGVHEDFDWEEP
jgi:hypothetical protein